MLYKLDDYKSWLQSIKNLSFNTYFAEAVLENKANGTVLVDNNQSLIYILHSYGMSLFYAKDADNKTANEAIKYLKRRVVKTDEYLQLYPFNLVDEFKIIYGNRIEENIRVNFKFDRELFNKQKPVLNDLHIGEFDGELFNKFTGSVIPLNFWRNADDFMHFSKGYYCLIDNQIASVAFGSFADDNMLEIGIETNPIFRGRGLAEIVCRKLIEYSLDHGKEPVWSCRKGNMASYKLAAKVGFIPTLELPYLHIKNF